MFVIDVVLALSLAQVALSAQPPARDPQVPAYRIRTFGMLLNPGQLLLRGPRDRLELSIDAPETARRGPGQLDLAVRFEGLMLPEANVQFFVNGHRRAMLLRSDARQDGSAQVMLPLTAVDLARGSVTLAIDARLVATGDDCGEQTHSTARLRIGPASSVRFALETGSVDSRQTAVDALPPVVLFSLRDGPTSPDDMLLLLHASSRLAQDGHTLRFAHVRGQTVLAMAQGGVTPADVMRSSEVDASPRAINPTLPELGAINLARAFTRAGIWRIPLDIRALPPGRVPERMIVKMVVAPDELDELLEARVYFNDFLLRRVSLLGNGSRRTIRLLLPQDELRIYNELRVVAERTRKTYGACTHEPVIHPGQIQEDSYLVTDAAPRKPRQFGTFVAALPADFDLFIPQADGRAAEAVLPVLLAAARSLWGPLRHPHVRMYAAGELPSPAQTAVVVETPSGVSTVVRLVTMNGHPILSIAPATNRPRLPETPDDYGTADSVAFGATGSAHHGPPPPPAERNGVDALQFALSYRVAVAFAALLLLSGTFAAYARLRRGRVRS